MDQLHPRGGEIPLPQERIEALERAINVFFDASALGIDDLPLSDEGLLEFHSLATHEEDKAAPTLTELASAMQEPIEREMAARPSTVMQKNEVDAFSLTRDSGEETTLIEVAITQMIDRTTTIITDMHTVAFQRPTEVKQGVVGRLIGKKPKIDPQIQAELDTENTRNHDARRGLTEELADIFRIVQENPAQILVESLHGQHFIDAARIAQKSSSRETNVSAPTGTLTSRQERLDNYVPVMHETVQIDEVPEPEKEDACTTGACATETIRTSAGSVVLELPWINRGTATYHDATRYRASHTIDVVEALEPGVDKLNAKKIRNDHNQQQFEAIVDRVATMMSQGVMPWSQNSEMILLVSQKDAHPDLGCAIWYAKAKNGKRVYFTVTDAKDDDDTHKTLIIIGKVFKNVQDKVLPRLKKHTY